MPYVQLRPSELVDQALVLGRRQFWPLLAIGGLPLLIAWELSHLARLAGVYTTWSGWGYLFSAYAFTALADAAMMTAAWKILHSQPVSLGAVWRQVGGRATSVVVGYLWRWMLFTFGIALLILPGLYIATLYFAIPGAFAIEDLGLVRGMRRSRELGAGALRLVFLSCTLFTVATLVVAALIPVFLRRFGAPTIAFRLVPLMWFLIVAPFRAALVARVYADRRAAKEGYDLDLLLAGLTSPA